VARVYPPPDRAQRPASPIPRRPAGFQLGARGSSGTRYFAGNERRSSLRAWPRELVAGFEPISLSELDEAASLQRRVDNKYLISRDQFSELAAGLRDQHRVLDIDGERASAYESVYFDTEELRCYEDHVA